MRCLTLSIALLATLATSQARATENWVQAPFNGHWYALTKFALQWHTAQEYAQSFGGSLGTVRSAAETQWILNQFTPTEAIWIGLNDEATEGKWVWASGEEARFRNWNAGEPNNANGGEDFVEMIPFTGLWNDATEQQVLRRALIEVGPIAAPHGGTAGPPTSDDQIPLVTSWKQSPTSGLWYARTLVGWHWDDAAVFAQTVGARLATIRDAAENTFAFTTFGGAGDLWLGINDVAVEGTFVWASGEPVTFTNWGAGEPNNAGEEDYGSMRGDGQWNDLPGTQTIAALLERVSPDDVTYHGAGCAGSGGFVPRMEWAGTTQSNTIASLRVLGGLGGAQAVILMSIVGGQSSINPFCSLNIGVPILPAIVGPFNLGGAGAGAGTVNITTLIPTVPTVVPIHMQAFIADSGAQSGYSNTAGMQVDFHP